MSAARPQTQQRVAFGPGMAGMAVARGIGLTVGNEDEGRALCLFGPPTKRSRHSTAEAKQEQQADGPLIDLREAGVREPGGRVYLAVLRAHAWLICVHAPVIHLIAIIDTTQRICILHSAARSRRRRRCRCRRRRRHRRPATAPTPAKTSSLSRSTHQLIAHLS